MFDRYINRLRGAVLALAAGATSGLGAMPAQAQNAETYPDKLVTVLVGYGPGGASDVTARLLASHMFADQGAQVIVENKPGAGGRLAAEHLTRQPADGYTLMVGGNSIISIAKAIYPDLRYDPIDDLTPISIIADFPNFIMVVPADHPAQTFAELVEWSKANPDSANYPTPGPSYTIPTEQLKLASGLVAQQVSYRSGNEAITSIVTGESSFMLADPASALPLLQGGTLRALAVTGENRMEALPDVPTLAEMNITVNMHLWTGLFAPAGTPDHVVDKLQAEVARVVQLPEVAEKLKGMGLEPGGNTSAEYKALIAQEVTDYTATVSAANLTFEQ